MSAARRAETSDRSPGLAFRVVEAGRPPAVQRMLPLGWWPVVSEEPTDLADVQAEVILTAEQVRALAERERGIRAMVCGGELIVMALPGNP